MKQAVSVFSNAAARTAAITAPVEGQLTYLEDTNLYSMWNGTSWISPFGSTLLNSTTFTSQTTINIDNVFSADYDYYKFYTTITGTALAAINLNLRASGSTISLANYNAQRFQLRDATFSNSLQASFTALSLSTAQNGLPIFIEGTVGTPFQATPTHFITQSVIATNNIGIENYHGRYAANTTATGFALTCANAITGTISIYGLRN
jgi:hypothetical protein